MTLGHLLKKKKKMHHCNQQSCVWDNKVRHLQNYRCSFCTSKPYDLSPLRTILLNVTPYEFHFFRGARIIAFQILLKRFYLKIKKLDTPIEISVYSKWFEFSEQFINDQQPTRSVQFTYLTCVKTEFTSATPLSLRPP